MFSNRVQLSQKNLTKIMLAALLFGAMRAGAALMQIKAGVPVELVDVVQSIILLFLVASVVFRRLFRLRGAKPPIATAESAVTATNGSEAEAEDNAGEIAPEGENGESDACSSRAHR